MKKEVLLEVKNLVKHFPIYGGVFLREKAKVHALNGVSFKLYKGETLGIVGESGCGKSTLGKTLIRLHQATSGQALFKGQNIFDLKGKDLRKFRKNIQMIFQDPYDSLNVRQSVKSILEEPYQIHNLPIENIDELLDKVGLQKTAKFRYPHEFSGGQRQRIGIARSIALRPELIICDEPVSALDVSVQSQVLNLLLKLQKEMNLTFMFIAHDLAVVKHISDRIAVMYLGHIVELASADTIYATPKHPYTNALIAAIPEADPEKVSKGGVVQGEIPSSQNLPHGCVFHTRCPLAQDICRRERPLLEPFGSSSQEHLVACHFK